MKTPIIVAGMLSALLLGGCDLRNAGEIYQEKHADEMAAERDASVAEAKQIGDLILHRVDPRSIAPVSDHVRWLQQIELQEETQVAAIHARDRVIDEAEGERVVSAFGTAKRCSFAGKLRIGMTEPEVIAVCRFPGHINKTQTAGHEYLQASYRWANGAGAYLYFTDGTLVSGQFSDAD